MTIGTLEELRAARETAGAAYASAVSTYLSSWIELRAMDMVLQNRYQHENIEGFSQSFPDQSQLSRHSEFLPAIDAGDLGNAALARYEALLGELGL